MHPDLASRYRNIRTFSGRGRDNPAAAVYLDWTSKGFHAMIMSPGEVTYIDPYYKNDNAIYVSYDREDYENPRSNSFTCGVQDDTPIGYEPSANMEASAAGNRTAITLRTYDIAIAATGEYTQFHGGAVADALDAIITSMNRVRGIYETELAISFLLVGNNDLIIYEDPVTDPYGDIILLTENQATIDAVIGSSYYDIGHVVGIGDGGVAALAAACNGLHKAKGITATQIPINDGFDVDFLAHEIGHQLGAHHTYNGSIGTCTAVNYHAITAFEPGSGSTIMSYAGLCESQNLQRHSHAYFHGSSLLEIRHFTVDSTGNSCGFTELTLNNPPTADANPNGMDGKYIPILTPFELEATGADPNGDELTFAWEEIDKGPQGPPSSSSATAPLFRSFLPTPSTKRMFPSLNDVMDNSSSVGEKLPSVARDLKFRVTARDNKTASGGFGMDNLTLHVVNTGGAFAITSSNASAEVNGSIPLTWNVAGTNNAPISCANVDIQLSLDGGLTFTDLIVGTPNDGSQTITLPNTATSNARIKVKCSNNVFFDINNADLRIAPSGATCVEQVSAGDMSSNAPWTENAIYSIIANVGEYHNAVGSAWIGGLDNDFAQLSQTISIPAGAHFANLEFWYHIVEGDCGGDVFNVLVDGAVVTSINYCDDPGLNDWVRKVIDLSDHIGSSAIIMFELTTNEHYPSEVYIDDVSVFTCVGGAFPLLPVELIRFQAKAEGNTAVLNWATASETNNQGFEVEIRSKSTDFQSVGFVKGHGTTNVENQYRFEVPGLSPGNYYFRLRQIDENGDAQYSPVRQVVIGGELQVIVQPNPVGQIAHFTVNLSTVENIKLEILDGIGRVIGTVAKDLQAKGQVDLRYDVTGLPSGVYHYRLSGNAINETGRFVVSR